MEILTKKFKKKFDMQLKVFMKSVWDNALRGGAASLLGFIITQFFWIWILIPFSGFLWNYISYLGVTEFTEFDFKKVFWLFYASWFTIMVMVKLFLNNYREDDYRGGENE